MAKKVKDAPNIFRKYREELGYSQEKAAELIDALYPMYPDRLGRIERGEVEPTPDQVYNMAKAYGKPDLVNHYCTEMCYIGQHLGRKKVEIKDLEKIVLETIANLNALNKSKDKLIEIAADGVIDQDEMQDFILIQSQLEKISLTVRSLELWAEEMLANGTIDKAAYELEKAKLEAAKLK